MKPSKAMHAVGLYGFIFSLPFLKTPFIFSLRESSEYCPRNERIFLSVSKSRSGVNIMLSQHLVWLCFHILGHKTEFKKNHKNLASGSQIIRNNISLLILLLVYTCCSLFYRLFVRYTYVCDCVGVFDSFHLLVKKSCSLGGNFKLVNVQFMFWTNGEILNNFVLISALPGRLY